MTRRRTLQLLGVSTALLFLVLAILDGRMQDAGGPGIVPFELAGTQERAAEIVADWGDDGLEAARWSLWLDFLFMASYGALLALASAAVRDDAMRRGWDELARPGTTMVRLAIAAAVFDAVENVNLLIAAGGDGGSLSPALAMGFAMAKFACLVAVLFYLAAFGVKRLRTRRAEPPAAA